MSALGRLSQARWRYRLLPTSKYSTQNPDAIDDMLEFATKLEYREESHWGKMITKRAMKE